MTCCWIGMHILTECLWCLSSRKGTSTSRGKSRARAGLARAGKHVFSPVLTGLNRLAETSGGKNWQKLKWLEMLVFWLANSNCLKRKNVWMDSIVTHSALYLICFFASWLLKMCMRVVLESRKWEKLGSHPLVLCEWWREVRVSTCS